MESWHEVLQGHLSGHRNCIHHGQPSQGWILTWETSKTQSIYPHPPKALPGTVTHQSEELSMFAFAHLEEPRRMVVTALLTLVRGKNDSLCYAHPNFYERCNHMSALEHWIHGNCLQRMSSVALYQDCG